MRLFNELMEPQAGEILYQERVDQIILHRLERIGLALEIHINLAHGRQFDVKFLEALQKRGEEH